jgi:hypothetical protein
MPTARYFIQDALEILQLYAPGEDASGADMARGLSVLNAMIDSWSNESLTCYAWKTNSFLLQPGIGQYTIGPGGVINDIRPLRVSDDAGSAYLLDVNNNRYPMDVLDQMAWNLRVTAVINSNLPDTLLYDPQYPLGIINIWPTPNRAYTCFFSSYLQLTEFAALDTPVTFPPGYNRPISTNLALSLKPYFRTAQIDPLVVEEARQTKGNIKRTNMRAQRAVYDPELIARGSSTYNIYTNRGA